MQNWKAIRAAAGKSRAYVAVHAGVSEPTAKLFETAGEDAVGERPRKALRAVYERMAADVASAGKTPQAAE
jgi:hypothetical protein